MCVVIIVGGLIMSVGFFFSFYVLSIFFLYISYGFLFGIGISFCVIMVLIVFVDYFDKYFFLVIGIVVLGSSFGILVFFLML